MKYNLAELKICELRGEYVVQYYEAWIEAKVKTNCHTVANELFKNASNFTSGVFKPIGSVNHSN